MADQKNESQQQNAAPAEPQYPTGYDINVKEPRFLGMRGKMLSIVVSIVATTGFLRKSSTIPIGVVPDTDLRQIVFGYDQGVMSGIIGAAPFNDYFEETKGNKTYQGFVTAIYEVGTS